MSWDEESSSVQERIIPTSQKITAQSNNSRESIDHLCGDMSRLRIDNEDWEYRTNDEDEQSTTTASERSESDSLSSGADEMEDIDVTQLVSQFNLCQISKQSKDAGVKKNTSMHVGPNGTGKPCTLGVDQQTAVQEEEEITWETLNNNNMDLMPSLIEHAESDDDSIMSSNSETTIDTEEDGSWDHQTNMDDSYYLWEKLDEREDRKEGQIQTSQDNEEKEVVVDGRATKGKQTHLPNSMQPKQKGPKKVNLNDNNNNKTLLYNNVHREPQTTLDSWMMTEEEKETKDEKSHLEAGDEILDPDQDTLRIMLQNVRGINPRIEDGTAQTGIAEMKVNKVKVYMFPESNVNWSNKKAMGHVVGTYKQEFNKSKITMSHCGLVHDEHRHTRVHLPGGTMMGILEEWTNRVRDSGRDKLGRWTWTTIAGGGNILLTLVTAYKIGGSKGGDKTFREQLRSKHIEEGKISPDPLKEWVSDFRTFMKELKAKGNEILVGIDANENLDEQTKKGTLKEIMNDLDLQDIMLARHKGKQLLNSVRGEKDRIDTFFGTPNVTAASTAIRQMNFEKGVESDHRQTPGKNSMRCRKKISRNERNS